MNPRSILQLALLLLTATVLKAQTIPLDHSTMNGLRIDEELATGGKGLSYRGGGLFGENYSNGREFMSLQPEFMIVEYDAARRALHISGSIPFTFKTNSNPGMEFVVGSGSTNGASWTERVTMLVRQAHPVAPDLRFDLELTDVSPDDWVGLGMLPVAVKAGAVLTYETRCPIYHIGRLLAMYPAESAPTAPGWKAAPPSIR